MASSAPVAYLDSSALVKLVIVEPETDALRRELQHWPRRVSSLLAAIEVTRTARRLGPRAMPLATRILGGLQLLAVEPIVQTAMQIGGALLRSLDAVHLATAASLGPDLGVLISYDHRMLAEAQALGLSHASPS